MGSWLHKATVENNLEAIHSSLEGGVFDGANLDPEGYGFTSSWFGFCNLQRWARNLHLASRINYWNGSRNFLCHDLKSREPSLTFDRLASRLGARTIW